MFALKVLQLDAKLRVSAGRFVGVATDVALPLKHFQDARTQLRGRRKNGILLRLLAVADAGEHITQGIGQCHCF